jgi:hypothetical protein
MGALGFEAWVARERGRELRHVIFSTVLVVVALTYGFYGGPRPTPKMYKTYRRKAR